jgi:single-strand DNA-binding protein
MAGSINKVIVIGNVGKDPEVRATQGGMRIANLTVATSESWKDKATGERKTETEWHRISIIGNDHLIDMVEKYVTKGAKVYVEGKLKTRKWTDQSGQDKYSTEIVLGRFAGSLEILSSQSPGQEARPAAAPVRPPAPAFDDEIPF